MQIGTDLSILNMGGGGWNVHLGVFGGWYDGHARNGRVSAFVVGNVNDGSDVRSFTINAGVRFNF